MSDDNSDDRVVLIDMKRQYASFSIEELEATDAVEQMVEEMVVGKMNWIPAALTVARARRGWYKEKFPAIPTHDQSRAAMLRRDPNFPLHRRVLELIELGRMFEQDRLLSDAQLEVKFPLMATNRLYWGVRTMDDVDRVFNDEVSYLLSIPGIFEIVYEMIPWLRERGWIGEPALLLILFNTMHFNDPRYTQVTDKVMDEGKKFAATSANSLAEPRKPGVVLRHRPRAFRP